MKITKFGLKGHAPIKGSGTTMEEAVTWAESEGKVVIPYDFNNNSHQNPQWLSFVLNEGTTYTITFPDGGWWLDEGGVAQVKDAEGNTVASITASYSEESGGIVTTPATVTPSGTGTYYLYVEYNGWNMGDLTIKVSVTPEPGSPPSTHFLPWESGFKKEGERVRTYTSLEEAILSVNAPGKKFAFLDYDTNYRSSKTTIICNNKLYLVWNGTCKLVDESRRYVGLIQDRFVLDDKGGWWRVSDNGTGDSVSPEMIYLGDIDGTVTFPEHIDNDYSFLFLLVNGKVACFMPARTGPGTIIDFPFPKTIYDNFPKFTMFSMGPVYLSGGNASTMLGSRCFGLGIDMRKRLYGWTMYGEDKGATLLDATGKWTYVAGSVGYYSGEWRYGLGIKDGALYWIYGQNNDMTGNFESAVELLDDSQTWEKCFTGSENLHLALTTSGALYRLKWNDYFSSGSAPTLSQVCASGCTSAAAGCWYSSTVKAMAVINGRLNLMASDGTLTTVGQASDWTEVLGGGYYSDSSAVKGYGYAVRNDKMYAVTDSTAYELPSFVEFTGADESSSSSSGSTPSSSPSEIIVTVTAGKISICTNETLTIVDPNATGTSRIWRNQYYDETLYEYVKTEVRYDSANGRWEIYSGTTQGGGENDWMPMGNPIYSETTTADPWTSGLNWYYVDLDVVYDATVSITLANGGSGSGDASSSSSSGGAASSISFTGDFVEGNTLHYSGTFLPTEYTLTVDEWDNVNHCTAPRAVPLYSGSIHVTGTEMDGSAADRYETLWLVPVQSMETWMSWWGYETDADKAAALEEGDNANYFPYFSWGIYGARTTSLLKYDDVKGYFLRAHCVVPPLANTNSVSDELGGDWTNCTITVS